MSSFKFALFVVSALAGGKCESTPASKAIVEGCKVYAKTTCVASYVIPCTICAGVCTCSEAVCDTCAVSSAAAVAPCVACWAAAMKKYREERAKLNHRVKQMHSYSWPPDRPFTQCAVLASPVNGHQNKMGVWDFFGVYHWFFIATTDDESLWFVAQFAAADENCRKEVDELDVRIQDLQQKLYDAYANGDPKRGPADQPGWRESVYLNRDIDELTAKRNELTAVSFTTATSGAEAVCFASSCPGQVEIAQEHRGVQIPHNRKGGRYVWTDMPPKTLNDLERLARSNEVGQREYHCVKNSCKDYADWMYRKAQK